MVTATVFEVLFCPLKEQVVRMRYSVFTVWDTLAVASVAPLMLLQFEPPFVEACHW
jgi:hypothetical protein